MDDNKIKEKMNEIKKKIKNKSKKKITKFVRSDWIEDDLITLGNHFVKTYQIISIDFRSKLNHPYPNTSSNY